MRAWALQQWQAAAPQSKPEHEEEVVVNLDAADFACKEPATCGQAFFNRFEVMMPWVRTFGSHYSPILQQVNLLFHVLT